MQNIEKLLKTIASLIMLIISVLFLKKRINEKSNK